MVEVRGLVQGVGFRPFIYRLANQFQLTGYVFNRSDGVVIKIQGSRDNIQQFLHQLEPASPPGAEINKTTVKEVPLEDFDNFEIIESHDISDEISEISPDIAVCEDCLEDMKHQSHRLNYPFINCTNCGPRFTIIKDFPYDRKNTTMKKFTMCRECNSEYSNPLDRRFHAQPVACNNCGPEYTLHTPDAPINGINEIISYMADRIAEGKIIAIKGLGGFHLLCNALDDNAVQHLRSSKKREGKPFAVMFKDMDTIRQYAMVNSTEEVSLTSWRRPVVLLNAKKNLAAGVCNDFSTIGAFLPYMPLHYLLFEKLATPAIVLTSGNFSDEPIIIENELALKQLGKITDAVLTYNRDIFNRTDDSVVSIINNRERIIRRSRGYVPNPVHVAFNADGIFATGAELVNTFCIGKDHQAILSQYIGDLKNYETYEFFIQTAERFKKLFRVTPSLVACDMHPDYLSTGYAENTGLPIIQIQHHHAHIASCMAEHGLDEPVIGVSFDGTGFGDDGHIWGSEFLVADLKAYERKAHFEYIELPGGDKVTEEPWRTAVAYLYKTFGKGFMSMNLPFLKKVPEEKLELILDAIDKKINCPLSCSAGRLFDAVAALTEICVTTDFHAEAPMRLEGFADGSTNDVYEYSSGTVISFDPMFRQIVADINQQLSVNYISTKFHNTMVQVILDNVKKLNLETGILKIALSGGTFQNKYLLEKVESTLISEKFEVFTQDKIPCNDGGIALGQLAIAAKNRAFY